MLLFFALALALVAVTALFLLPPLWWGVQANANEVDQEATNLSIFRDQLAELEREKADGSLAEKDYAQAQRELQRRLLEEVPGQAKKSVVANQRDRSPSLAILLGGALIILSFVGYGILGQPNALDPARTASQPKMTAGEIQQMVDRLAQRMKENPGDTKGWLMLARSYKMMERFDDAAKAYAQAESAIQDDADLLADYAETLALAQGAFKGKVVTLVERVLKLNPEHPHGLLLAGTAAMERGDKAAAIRNWEKVLPMVEAGSEMEQAIRSAIDKLKSK